MLELLYEDAVKPLGSGTCAICGKRLVPGKVGDAGWDVRDAGVLRGLDDMYPRDAAYVWCRVWLVSLFFGGSSAGCSFFAYHFLLLYDVACSFLPV